MAVAHSGMEGGDTFFGAKAEMVGQLMIFRRPSSVYEEASPFLWSREREPPAAYRSRSGEETHWAGNKDNCSMEAKLVMPIFFLEFSF